MKPLSAERRKWIEKKFGFWDCSCSDREPFAPCPRCEAIEVFEDATFWREVVKNSPDSICQDGFTFFCQYCREQEQHIEEIPVKHKPDCPWLLAQEPQ